MRLAVLTGLLTCVSGCGLFLDPSFPDAGLDANQDITPDDTGRLDAFPFDATGLDMPSDGGLDATASAFDAPSLDATALDVLLPDAWSPTDAPLNSAVDATTVATPDAPRPADAGTDAGGMRITSSTAAGRGDFDVSADGESVVVAGAASRTLVRSATWASTDHGFATSVTTVADFGGSFPAAFFASGTTRWRTQPLTASAPASIAGISRMASAGDAFGMTSQETNCALGTCYRFDGFGEPGCVSTLPANTRLPLLAIGTAVAISDVYSLSMDGSCHVAAGVLHRSQAVLGVPLVGLILSGPVEDERRIYLDDTAYTSAATSDCDAREVSRLDDATFGNDVAVMELSGGPVLATTAANGVQFVTGTFQSLYTSEVTTSVALGSISGRPSEAIVAYTAGGAVVVQRIQDRCAGVIWSETIEIPGANQVRVSDCTVESGVGLRMTMAVGGTNGVTIFRMRCD